MSDGYYSPIHQLKRIVHISISLYAANACAISIWYATFCVVGVVLLLLCLGYYLAWIHVLPRLGAYTMVLETVELQGGVVTNRFKKVRRGESLKGFGDGEDKALLSSNE